jgi:phasin family protein
MLVTQEQITAANKANMETLANLSRQAFQGVEKLLELNLQVAKTLMQENVEFLEDSAAAKDAKEFFSKQASYAQPMAEKAISYSRHLYNIAQQTQANLSDVSKEDMKKRTEHFQEMLKNMSDIPPNSSNAMINMIKQAVANANTTFEASQKAIKQATDITSHQTQTVAKSAIKASEKILKSATAN